MRWKQFEELNPELAEEAREILEKNGLALVGTIRKDGFPRISPTEVFFTHGELLAGMMRKSRKASDLLRDPRCVVHSTVSDPNGSEPELKLYCRAIESGEESTAHYVEAYTRRWKRRPPPSFPGFTFSMDVDSAALIRYDTKKNRMHLIQWSSKRGLTRVARRYP